MDQDQTPAPAPQPTEPVVTPPAQPVSDDPGKGFGIASLIVSIVNLGAVGIILGIIGLNKSKKVGKKNTPALIGIILGAVGIVVTIVVVSLLVIASTSLYSQKLQECKDLIPGSNPTLISSGGELKCSYPVLPQ